MEKADRLGQIKRKKQIAIQRYLMQRKKELKGQ